MTQGNPSGDVPLRHAGRGSAAAVGDARHHRAKMPVDRTVLWKPRRDPGDPIGPAEQGPYELFLTRSALRQIERRSREAEDSESHFGFLLGRLYRCPETGVHYSVVDRVIPAGERMSEDAPDPYLLRAWAEAQPIFREHGGVLIGWYHTHYLLGLMLSEGDREMNDRYFGEPWQCCVLTVPDPARPLGGVFRPSGGDEGIGSEIGPFRELLAVEDMPVSGPIPTVVRWKNYEPDREVKVDEEKGAGEVEAAAASEAPSVEPVGSGRGSTPSSMTLVLADNENERLYPRLPIRRRAIIWLLAIVAVAIGGYWGGLQLFESGGEPEAPAVTPAQRPPPVAPEVQDFRDAATQLEQAMLRYEERRQDFDLGRIGCELLAGGYAGADGAFVSMAAAYAALGEAADESLEARYEQLVVDMNRLNEHFDTSGCPRPE
jgi:proteasome lid subunit RPN8/RPN11